MQRTTAGTLLVATPTVRVRRTSHEVAWPHGGLPAVLDAASATILDCFAEPATTDQVIDDLVAVLGLDEADLRSATERVVDSLVVSGHMIDASTEPLEPWRLAYPPSASP